MVHQPLAAFVARSLTQLVLDRVEQPDVSARPPANQMAH